MNKDTNAVIEQINAGGDQVLLVGSSLEALNFESQDPDVYSEGITELAFDFVNPVFVQVPTVMDHVKVRICDSPPAHLIDYAADGMLFAFFEVDYRSTGGAIVFRANGDGTSQVDNAEKVETTVGYVVAEKVVIHHGPLTVRESLAKGTHFASGRHRTHRWTGARIASFSTCFMIVTLNVNAAARSTRPLGPWP